MINYFNEKSLHSIDSKGRILLPRDIRRHFGIKKADALHLIPNLSGPAYLEVRPASLWKAYRDSILQQESGEKKKDLYRYAMMLQETATVDGQGRMLIPQRIREMCKLSDTVAIVNMNIHIEIWAKEHVEQRYADMVRAFKELSDRLF